MKRLLLTILALSGGLLSPQQVLAVDFHLGQQYLTPYYIPDSTLTISSCSGSTNLVGGDNVEQAFAYLVSVELPADLAEEYSTTYLTPEQAAGIVGNLYAESKVDPTIHQIGGGPGRGIAQWETSSGSGRWDIYLSFAAERGVPDIYTMAPQLDYLWFELTGEPDTPGVTGNLYRSSLTDLLTKDTIRGAAESFLKRFERPRNQSQNVVDYRTNLAQGVFDNFSLNTDTYRRQSSGFASTSGRCQPVYDISGCPTDPVPEDRVATEIVLITDGFGNQSIDVHTCIAATAEAMIAEALADGIILSGGGFRSNAEQIRLRRAHCGTSDYDIFERPSSQCTPPTARPGRSNHERGLALDLRSGDPSSLIRSRGSDAFRWLDSNASRFGFFNLPSEPWHWSINGK